MIFIIVPLRKYLIIYYNMQKNRRSNLRYLRYVIQWVVFFSVLYAGYKFYIFVKILEDGLIPSIKRPPSVEGFMPIGALMALKLFIVEGIFDTVHPAGLVIFISVLMISILFKKSFCGWICPVGTLSEVTWKMGRLLFKKNFILPIYIDYPLRSIKYLLMAFFLYVILIKMSSNEIISFLNSPYWKVADIKLLKFFIDISTTTLITLLSLFVLSFLYKNFWCRYLCPYGALLGLLSIMSPFKIKRNISSCINCGSCARNCPSLIAVDKKKSIYSPECSGCMTCLSYCPEKGVLDFGIGNLRVSPYLFIISVLIIFYGLIIYAKIIDRWQSSVTVYELLNLMPYLDLFVHP